MLSVSAALLAGLLAASNPAPLLTIKDPALAESSGLASSLRHHGVLWTHNDGGSTAEIFGIDRSGRSVADITLRGIDPWDPEAIAAARDDAGRPALFLGDIGDNKAERTTVSVFRVTEPRSLGDHVVDPTWFRFFYDDGPHDAEALMVDPRNGRIWVATKSLGVAGLYRGPRKLVGQSQGVNRLTRVADAPPLVTDAVFLPGGNFVLRTYTAAYLYDRPGHLREQIVLPLQPQGESIAFDGDRLLAGSEGLHSKIYAVDLPSDVAKPTATASTGSSNGGDKGVVPDRVAGRSRGWLVGGSLVGGAALVLLVGGLLTRLARRRRR